MTFQWWYSSFCFSFCFKNHPFSQLFEEFLQHRWPLLFLRQALDSSFYLRIQKIFPWYKYFKKDSSDKFLKDSRSLFLFVFFTSLPIFIMKPRFYCKYNSSDFFFWFIKEHKNFVIQQCKFKRVHWRTKIKYKWILQLIKFVNAKLTKTSLLPWHLNTSIAKAPQAEVFHPPPNSDLKWMIKFCCCFFLSLTTTR